MKVTGNGIHIGASCIALTYGVNRFANARRMALAWNSHDDLLAALHKFGRHATKCDFYVYEQGKAKTAEEYCDCGLVAVIARAEGRQS